MLLTLAILVAIGLSLAMGFAWAVQRMTKNSGWVDTIWSASTGIFALLVIVAIDNSAERRWAAALLVGLWALRLANHIGQRSKGSSEDPRYEALMAEWGTKANIRLFWFLQIQALAALILVMSVAAAASVARPFGQLSDWIAILLAIIALVGEALSDQQLARFRKQNAGRKAICEEGFWQWSRHPNYFFEWLFWCAWPVMALGTIASAPVGFALSLLAPAMMYWLLVHVSGIPPLEAHMLRSRGEKFRALQARVNAFFPGPTRTLPAKEVLK
jgi:steroid 5-alpha reductase family enzyme